MRISGITYVPRKTHRVRNSILTLCILILVVSIILMFISAYTAWKFTHPAKISIPAFSSNIAPEYRNISFTGKDKNINLKGWYFRAKDSEKTVVIAHGYRQNRLQFKEQTLDIVKGLLNNGYNVLSFDFRNSGESDGTLTTLGLNEKDDLTAAVKFAQSQGAKKIILMGFYTGASASLLAAADNPDVAAVIADSPYSDLKQYLEDNFSVWTHLPSFPFNETTLFCFKAITHMDYSRVSPLQVVDRIAPRPVLLIHSKNDPYIPVSNSQELYRAFSLLSDKNTEFWETENAASFETYPQEYMDRVLKFLEKTNTKK